MAALGLILSGVLALANKKLHVFEDPRIDQVEAMLPQANCGACGLPGCRAFAEAVVGGEVSPGKCAACSRDVVREIAELLGVEAGAEEKRVARCACAGGANVAKMHARYRGIATCRAAALVSGGGKACPWGCLGYGDCAAACRFDAIAMNAYGLPEVDEDTCTACGACVEACPKDLFSIHPVSHRLWVACKNRAAGKEAKAQCEAACIGCGRCVKDAPSGMIAIVDHLAVIDYDAAGPAAQDAIANCPTGAIVWLDKEKGAVRGAKAEKKTHKTPAPVA